MHGSADGYVGEWVTKLKLENKKTLDIGSLDVNGNNKKWFAGEYTGLDFRKGPNVDLVTSSWFVPKPSASYEVIVCTEMLEHDEFPAATFAEIRRLIKPLGHVIITCRGPGYPLHEFPSDYHRFTPQDLSDWLIHLGFKVVDSREDKEFPGAFAVGFLPKNAPPVSGDPPVVRGIC